MGMFDRLGNVIKSYLNDEDRRIFGSGEKQRSPSTDPDFEAAFDELNDFLRGGRGAASGRSDASGENGARTGAERSGAGRPSAPPEDLRPDFAALGLPFGASAEECKAAYKKLLKLHHPDRHAGHEGNFKKATEKTVRINAAYDRIEKWVQQKAAR
jgi:DnaJ-domain-containing protein 1